MAIIDIEYNSGAIQRTVKFKAVLPFDLPRSSDMEYIDKKFRTVYLLNGLNGNMSDYHNHIDLIKLSEEKSVAFIMASGENSFYIDLPMRHNKYGEFIGKELVEISRKLLPLSTDREDTAIMGLSMGGFGALRLGFCYPENFSFIGAFSSAVNIFEDAGDDPDLESILEDGFLDVFGDLKAAAGTDKNPYYGAQKLMEQHKQGKAKIPDIYMSCGLSDPLIHANRVFMPKLKELGYKVEYQEWEGAHDWEFWSESLKRSLDAWTLSKTR